MREREIVEVEEVKKTFEQEVEEARLETVLGMAQHFMTVQGARSESGAPIQGFVNAERRKILDALEVLFMPPEPDPIDRLTAAIGPAVASVTPILVELLQKQGASVSIPETSAEARELTDEMLHKALSLLTQEFGRRGGVASAAPPPPPPPPADVG